MASIKKDIQSRVENAIRDEVENQGVELLEVKYLKEEAKWILRIIIDKRGGISLDDCERVSRTIDPIIDEEVEIKQAYYLEVQSPGIDRPLKTAADFARYIGSEVEISFYQAQNGQKKIEGVLLGSEEDKLNLDVDNKPVSFLLEDIAKVKRVINFK